MASEPQQRELGDAAARTTTDPIVMAAAASVLLSWYQFFVRGNREMGIFVGLWPPTLLAFASYFKQERMIARVENIFSGGRIREMVERMVGGQG